VAFKSFTEEELSVKHILYIVMILNLLGCGTDDRRNKYVVENVGFISNYGEYGEYVSEFKDMVESWTGARPSDVIGGIAYRKTSIPHIWATCKLQYADDAETVIYRAVVELDPNMKGMSPELFRITLWHELGHCIMNSNHVDDKNDLMYPYTFEKVINAETDLRTINYMERLSEGRNS